MLANINDPLPRRAPTLDKVSVRLLEWVDSARLAPKTKTYYRDGWRLLTTTFMSGMRLEAINNTDGAMNWIQRNPWWGSHPGKSLAHPPCAKR
jgi:hypothetical protein